MWILLVLNIFMIHVALLQTACSFTILNSTKNNSTLNFILLSLRHQLHAAYKVCSTMYHPFMPSIVTYKLGYICKYNIYGAITLVTVPTRFICGYFPEKYFNTHYKVSPYFSNTFTTGHYRDIVNREIYKWYPLNVNTWCFKPIMLTAQCPTISSVSTCTQHATRVFTIHCAWCSMLNCFFRLNLYLTQNKPVLFIKTVITARDHTTHTGFHVQCLLFLVILIKIKCFDKC